MLLTINNLLGVFAMLVSAVDTTTKVYLWIILIPGMIFALYILVLILFYVGGTIWFFLSGAFLDCGSDSSDDEVQGNP